MLILPLLAAAALSVYSGREANIHVKIPRLELAVKVDGSLSEPAWQQAALLNGFSQFSPQDGIPAADSTQVLVWYSATAIHFGIRAFEEHGAVHATRADRDKIYNDDNIQIFLGTFHDRRQATVFGVNPFGVQLDGTEIRITVARNRYIKQVADYNTLARRFPTTLTAMAFSYPVKPSFTVHDEAQVTTAPAVDFSKAASKP